MKEVGRNLNHPSSRSLSLFYLIDLGAVMLVRVVTSVISDVMSRVRLVALHQADTR